MRNPDVIIIGAQKSGSTSLQDALSQHPDIYMRREEVTALESPDYEAGVYEKLQAHLARQSAPVVGIKRPTYLSNPQVPGRVAQVAPKAKLLAVLRNPYTRLVSAYYHYVSKGFIPPQPLADGLRAAALDPDYAQRWPKSQEVFSYGRYWTHISRYRDAGLAQNLRVYRLEDMRRWDQSLVMDLAEHLNVSADPLLRFDFPTLNQRPASLYRARFEAFLERHGLGYPTVGLTQFDDEVPAGSRSRLMVRRAGKSLLGRLSPGSDQSSNPRPSLEVLDSTTTEWLLELYEPEIRALSANLDETYQEWSRA